MSGLCTALPLAIGWLRRELGENRRPTPYPCKVYRVRKGAVGPEQSRPLGVSLIIVGPPDVSDLIDQGRRLGVETDLRLCPFAVASVRAHEHCCSEKSTHRRL